LDGKLLAQPEFEGVKDWDKSGISLPAYAVETWGPLVFVHLGTNPLPVLDLFGNIPSEIEANGFKLDDLEFLQRRDYVIQCNWKVYVDNYLEGYHIPIVHPGLFKELDYERYRVNTFRYHSSQDAPIRPAQNAETERRYADAKTDALYYWIFPNLMISVYPDHLHSTIVVPLSPDQTLTRFEWFFRKLQTAQEREAAQKTMEFTNEVQQQDITICEAVQRGLQSRTYHQGRYSVKRENGVHHFHLLLDEFLHL
jgi:choline monooxygenase